MEVKKKSDLNSKGHFSAQFLSHRKAMLITFRIRVFFKYLSLFLALSSDGINRASPKKKVHNFKGMPLFLRKKRPGYTLVYPGHTEIRHSHS